MMAERRGWVGGPRVEAFWFSVLWVPVCWLGMMACHEVGHALGGWGSGGTVVDVELPLAGFSHTLVSPNPRPLVERACGPLAGCLLPGLVYGLACLCRDGSARRARFFWGFCLIANGAYLGLGWIDGAGDAGDLMGLGVPAWGLVVFGAAVLPAGVAMWNHTASGFGWGDEAAGVLGVTDWVEVGVLLAGLVGLSWWLSG